MRIGITYNLKSDFPAVPGAVLARDAQEEFDLPGTVEAIRAVLAEEGNEVLLLGGDLGVVEKIRQNGIEFVFNIAEGFQGRSREAHLPSLLEMLGIPYSGSDPAGLAVTLDKSLAKRIALSLGIPTPKFWVLEDPSETKEAAGPFPLFVKPLWQGSSIGIRRSSRVEDRASLEREVETVFEGCSGEPVLVEAYVAGQEVTVGILGNSEPEVLGAMEVAFKNSQEGDFCYSLEVKRRWRELVDYHCPPRLDSGLVSKIEEAALSLFKAMRLRDFARIDFRVDREGHFYLLEANPLAGLSPDSGDLVLLAQKRGWNYRDLLLKITRSAMTRYPHLAAAPR